MAKLNVGDIIEVHGFTMLRGMKGKLRVSMPMCTKERSMPIGSRDLRALSLL
jgi:hypothetical protein